MIKVPTDEIVETLKVCEDLALNNATELQKGSTFGNARPLTLSSPPAAQDSYSLPSPEQIRQSWIKLQEALINDDWGYDPCLQCYRKGLRCSFSSAIKDRRRKGEGKKNCCTRCERNGEDFCVLHLQKAWQGSQKIWQYVADGASDEVVKKRVENIEREEYEKFKWALPRPADFELKKRHLRPVAGLYRD